MAAWESRSGAAVAVFEPRRFLFLGTQFAGWGVRGNIAGRGGIGPRFREPCA